MNFRSGARGGMRRRRGGVANGTIDLTPLIDVTFQLLIFFLLTASFRNESAFKLQLPKAQSHEPVTEQKAVVIKISEDGRFEIDKKVVDMRELEMRLCNAQDEGAAATVNIKADRNTKHENVVKAMDIARSCGIKKMGILSKQ
ncbi:MAG: biopolymer transporter ExbD [Myxococcales bacterium]|nr:biopolymer transporter ExbD [Myxococcales bacterium]